MSVIGIWSRVVDCPAFGNSELLCAMGQTVNTTRSRYDCARIGRGVLNLHMTMDLKDVFIFANPIAGRGRGKIIADRLHDAARDAGYRVRCFFDRADRIHSDDFHVDHPPRAAIVIGGDGTLRTVARRIIQENPPGDKIPLLIVPMGTANLMGKHLGIKWTKKNLEEEVLETLRHRQIARLDAATANGVLFLLMAGIGIDGYVVHELD